MPEVVFLWLNAAILLEKEGRNGYFRLRLLAEAQKGASGKVKAKREGRKRALG